VSKEQTSGGFKKNRSTEGFFIAQNDLLPDSNSLAGFSIRISIGDPRITIASRKNSHSMNIKKFLYQEMIPECYFS
jgi:hypothetical protein